MNFLANPIKEEVEIKFIKFLSQQQSLKTNCNFNKWIS